MSNTLMPACIIKVWNSGGSGQFTEVQGASELQDGTKLYTADQVDSIVALSTRLADALSTLVANGGLVPEYVFEEGRELLAEATELGILKPSDDEE